MRRARIVDLFAGAGGFSLGFHAAGATIAAAVDVSEPAGATFQMNFARLQPASPFSLFSGDEGNLEDLDLTQIVSGPPDILIGGPPCQGFSRAGRAKLASLSDDPHAEDPRNHLYLRFVNAVALWRPLAVVMENVADMRSSKGANIADAIADDLARCGYRVRYAVLNAVWYGVPQFRERLFFVGIRDDLGLEPSVPAATHHAFLSPAYFRPPVEVTIPFGFVPHYELGVKLDSAQHEATTTCAAIDDLPEITEHLRELSPAQKKNDFRTPCRYSATSSTTYARLMRSWPGLVAPDVLEDHVIRRTPRDYETFRRMRPGDRYTEALPLAEARFAELLSSMAQRGQPIPSEGTVEHEELKRSIVPRDSVDKFLDRWRKLDPSAPAWTVHAHLAKDGHSHIHYDSGQARAISVREAARLQSFPDGFVFTGTMGDCFTQIGNAVPPLLAWALAAHLLAQLGMYHVLPPYG